MIEILIVFGLVMAGLAMFAPSSFSTRMLIWAMASICLISSYMLRLWDQVKF